MRRLKIPLYLIVILIICLISTTTLAWVRIDNDTVQLSNDEVQDLLKAKLENEQLQKEVDLFKQQQTLEDKEVEILNMRIDLEKERADFEHHQFVQERETRQFEAEQYKKLLDEYNKKPRSLLKRILCSVFCCN